MMNKYQAYKSTGISWTPSIPEHWSLMRGKLFFYNNKELNKGNQCSNVLSLTLKGVINNSIDRPIGLAPQDYATYQLFDAGNLVFKLIDLENISTSRVGLVHEHGIMSSAYIRLINRYDCNIRYFYFMYYDLYLRNIYNGLGAGVRSTLNATDLLNIPIYVPPREEQDKIVEFLDWKLSCINKLISIKKKQIITLQERQRVFVSRIVTHGLESNEETKESGIDWIGKIPRHWEIIRCKYLFKERDERSEKGEEQHLSMSQKYGLVPDSQLDERRMLSESYKGGKLCYRDDLVLNRLKAHLGVFALAPQLGVISPDYTVLVPNKERIIPEYAEIVLKSEKCRGELKIRVRGIIEGFWRLYTDDFNTIVLPIPPIEEQRNIMKCISVFRERTNGYEDILNKEIDALKELKTRIISDVVTGKIDVRNIEIPEYVFVEEDVDSDSEIEENTDDTEEQED